jgi:hypothetical protein
MIFVPLLDKEPGTGKRIDYQGLSKFERRSRQNELAQNLEQVAQPRPRRSRSRIGFAKLVGELIDGLIR